MNAIDHKNIEALNKVGNFYSKGDIIEKNYDIAYSYFFKGAEKGDLDAMNNVAWSYEYGKGVDYDYKKAIEWYKKVNNGYSNRHIGNIYLEGKGEISINRELAKEYFEKAVKLGDEIARNKLKDEFYGKHKIIDVDAAF